MNENLVFQRIEKKYLLNKDEYRTFLEKSRDWIQADSYGKHTICNIYYDTKNYELIRTSIEKPDYKEKFRLRSYGTPEKNSNVFLELKKKVEGIVYKRRVSLSYEEALKYLRGGIYPCKDTQILREIDYFIHFYHPEPKLYLAYDRVAYYGKENQELRFTFDTRIRSRNSQLFLDRGDQGELLTDENTYLLEIKVPGAFPVWLARLLSDLSIYPVSFSKYGNIYKGMQERRNICSKVS